MGKPQFRFGSKAMRMIGRGLYDMHPAPIAVRELLQNALDACRRKGVQPEISVSVERVGTETTIVCEDNGCGMTDNEIYTLFLQVSPEEGIKKEEDSGGFGVAKVVLTSGLEWTVETLDWIIDNNEDTRLSGNHLDGTKVTVKYDEPWSWYTERHVAFMVYFSDIDICFKYTVDDVLKVYDEHAGLKTPKKALEANDLVSTFGLMDVQLPFSPTYTDPKVRGKNIFRLNGLVQFEQPTSLTRDTNLIFEVHPSCRPGDTNYPFTLSREQVKGATQEICRAIAEAHSLNPTNSRKIIEDKPKKNDKIPGKHVKGQRPDIGIKPPSVENASTMHVSVSGDGIPLGSVNERVMKDPNQIALLFHDYRGTAETADKHASILNAWSWVIQIVASEDEDFGVGLTGDPDLGAFRVIHDGDLFYVVNPDYFNGMAMTEEIIWSMYQLACHEASHKYSEGHNQYFCSVESMIYRMCVKRFLLEVPDIRKEL